MRSLEILAQLLYEKNKIEEKITQITGRPALIGHTGEFIASIIFGIQLEESATSPGLDGIFIKGELKGKSVNIKWYPKNERLLDIREEYIPEYYLVLTGPYSLGESSRNKTRPWLINSVFLLDAKKTVCELKEKGRRIGVATSLRKKYWDLAEIYPTQSSSYLYLSDEQRSMLRLFNKYNT